MTKSQVLAELLGSLHKFMDQPPFEEVDIYDYYDPHSPAPKTKNLVIYIAPDSFIFSNSPQAPRDHAWGYKCANLENLVRKFWHHTGKYGAPKTDFKLPKRRQPKWWERLTGQTENRIFLTDLSRKTRAEGLYQQAEEREKKFETFFQTETYLTANDVLHFSN